MRRLFVLLLTAVTLAQGLYTDVKAEGVVGVQLDPAAQGAIVKKLLPGGPAELAGLKVGDLVVSIDGVPLAGKSLTQALALCRKSAGTKAPVEVRRGEETKSVELTWAAIPPEALAQLEAAVREKKSAVPGVIERQQGNLVGILLDMPVAQAFSPGALVGIMPDETLVGEGKVTRIVSHFRLEAELKPGAQARLWDKVVVTP